MPRDPLLLIIVVNLEVEFLCLPPLKTVVVVLLGLAWLRTSLIRDRFGILAVVRLLEIGPVA